jgi:hypothetical protein
MTAAAVQWRVVAERLLLLLLLTTLLLMIIGIAMDRNVDHGVRGEGEATKRTAAANG